LSELETANAEASASVSESLPTPQAPEAVASPPSPASQREAAEAAMDSDLMKVWEKNNPARDDAGRFQSKNPEAPAAETPTEATGETNTEGQTLEAKPVEQAKPAIDPPASWSREVREKWATLPPDVQEYVARRESEAHSQISRLGQTAKAAEPLLSVIEQNRELFDRRQVSPDQGIAALLGAQRKLDENPVAAIGWLAQQYGVDLAMFANPDANASTQDPMVVGLQHELANLRRELAETKGTVQSRIQAEQQAQFTQYQTTVESFLAGKELSDSDEAELVVLVNAEKQLNPGKTPEQLLKDAYETFQYRSPERRAKMLEQQMAEQRAKDAKEAEKKATEAKKLQSMNVRSTPAGSSNAKSMDDTLQEIARRAYAR
jgi:hypothetical protein